jgi:ribonuclease HI
MKERELKKVDIYTDGGCISNPGGNGGYGSYFYIYTMTRGKNYQGDLKIQPIIEWN